MLLLVDEMFFIENHYYNLVDNKLFKYQVYVSTTN